MTLHSPADILRVAALALAALCTAAPARAADLPDILRGPVVVATPLAYGNWEGINLGAHFGYSNLIVDFSDVNTGTSLQNQTTNSTSFGGFLGYNWQWEHLVVGLDMLYNRPASLETSSSSGGVTAYYKMVDWGTFRARAGYAFGQFLPYAFAGGGVGRVNYQVTEAGITTNSRDNAFTGAFTTGLGLDVLILPNLFLRAEYEFNIFTPTANIRAVSNTGRVGIGMRF